MKPTGAKRTLHAGLTYRDVYGGALRKPDEKLALSDNRIGRERSIR